MAHVEIIVNNVIQKELRYDTDNITADGWTFLDEECPPKLIEKLSSNDDINTMSDEEIYELTRNLLSDMTKEYEMTHPNIRYYE